jgi:DNA-binding CsgD family transcriptional regulator/tetratricopeptide (TPR) repeat protein
MLVGRRRELAALDDALREARQGNGSTVVLAGEPGIGKTRLARETLARALSAGMVTLRGRASSTGPAMPFRPLSEALLSLARSEDAPPPAELGPYLPALGRLVPDWATNQSSDASLIVLAEAVLRLSACHGRGRGCLLVLDDLQWADPETLAVLDYLVSNLRGQPVALLLTVRMGASPAARLLDAMARRGEARSLTLERLAEGEVRALAAAVLDCAPADLDDEVAAQLYLRSSGNPFIVEELTHGMRSGADIVRAGNGWRLADDSGTRMPMSLVQAVEQRAQQLGPDGMRILSVAAVLGRRFPLTVVRRCVGLADQTVLAHIRAAIAARLLLGNEREPDWYSFEHPLTEEALLSLNTAAERVALSRQAAAAVDELYPGLPGNWCHLAAHLWRQAGDLLAAARLYLEIARRALSESGQATAIAVLDDALDMLTTRSEDRAVREIRWDLLETLLVALAENGQFDRAAVVAEELRVGNPLWDTARQVRLQVRLAWAAQNAGRWADGVRCVEAARALLPAAPSEVDTAPIDVVSAYLTVSRTGADTDHVSQSEALARRAVRGVALAPDAEVACQAWFAIGFATQAKSMSESNDAYRRTLTIAIEHGLTSWRNHGLIGLGINDWLAEGGSAAMTHAHRETLASGHVSLALNVHANLAYAAVLRAEFDRTEQILAEVLAESTRLRLDSVNRYALMLRAVLAAHQGRRQEMRTALREFRARGGEQSREVPLARGLAELFCALLTEDRAGAETLAAELAERFGGQQSYFHFSGTNGLVPLLDALGGRLDAVGLHALQATETGRMRWNRQFLQAADAVLLGRAGEHGAAVDAMDSAIHTAQPFPTARNLCLRLVAEAALADGWGTPGPWLAEAESYFHDRIPVIAGACRGLLRQAGEPVRYHVTGTEAIPDEVRGLGITSREFEVLQLLPERLGNRDLSERLHISVRTVEKHMAALLAKTRSPDRAALCEYAAQVLLADHRTSST